MEANNAALSVADFGHNFAMCAASSGLTPSATLSEKLFGITQVGMQSTKNSVSKANKNLLKPDSC